MSLKDFLFPKFCLSCGKFDKYICQNCSAQLRLLSQQNCFYCQQLNILGLTHRQCLEKDGLDGIISPYKYNNFLKKLIKTIKYRLIRDLLAELMDHIDMRLLVELEEFINSNGQIFWQAVPLHNQRLKQRGFNQAELIIEVLQKKIAVVKTSVLMRQIDTLPQAQITNHQERLKNIRGAFTLSVPRSLIVGKNFFLVDDVVTTGATVKEAAACLKHHGAAKTYVFSLAKG